MSDPTAGKLRIGSTESIAAGLLPAVIERFSRRYPRIQLHVAQTLLTPMHYRELRERAVDLLLGRIPWPFVEEDLEADVLFNDQVVVVAGKRTRWARARRLELADLAGEAWILPPADTLAWSLTADLFRAGGVRLPRAPLSTLSMHLCCRLVASGRFVTPLPSSIMRFSNKAVGLKALPIRLPVQARPVGIVTLKGRALSPVAQLFIDCARDTAKPLAKGKWLSI